MMVALGDSPSFGLPGVQVADGGAQLLRGRVDRHRVSEVVGADDDHGDVRPPAGEALDLRGQVGATGARHREYAGLGQNISMPAQRTGRVGDAEQAGT